MKIATWNVNGLRAREAQLVEWLGVEQPDVVCLQEIKATAEQIPPALDDLPAYRAYWHGFKGYSGVALLVRRDRWTDAPFTHPAFDLESRIVQIGCGDIEVSSIYVPNGGKDYEAKKRFLEAMVDHAARAKDEGRSIVLCGDMNVAATDRDVHPKEKKPVIGQSPEERGIFARLLERGGLVDLGRAMDPDNDGLFTWWAPWRNLRQRNIGWRLDYVLVSQGLAARARSCVVRKDVGTSDHAPVVADFGE